uniref:NADH-ubiquinone oxidoreductase chain 4L n=1 Tax=Thaumastocoris safordi TaxID=1589682 RepID=A0A8T9ZXU2_9HEMI|nr:NADH dehydrogenase subunit 4L [Thaumastocoris safordi]
MNLMMVINMSAILGLMVFISMRKHLLLTMFSLEFVTVNLFLLLFLKVSFLLTETYFLVLFLVFTVCEGVLGLSILVNLIRCHGNDKVSTISGMLW